MAETVMVVSGKGGVGKSTLCIHIAAGLARRGKRVLVVESDTGFRGLDLLLGLEGGLYDLSDVLEGRCSLADALQLHSPTGVRLLLAPGDPEYLPKKHTLSALFAWGEENLDFLLVDCGAGFGPLDGMMARQCGSALVVTVPEEISARGAAKVSGFLARRGLSRQRLIINRIPKRFVPTKTVRDLDDIIDLVGVQLIGAVPEEAGLGAPDPERTATPALEELDRIARRLLGENPELVLFH